MERLVLRSGFALSHSYQRGKQRVQCGLGFIRCIVGIPRRRQAYPIELWYAGLTHGLYTAKPIIAAVNGLTLGGGFEVILYCDLAVASQNAEFALPGPLVGAAAIAGGMPCLCRKIAEINDEGCPAVTGEIFVANGAAFFLHTDVSDLYCMASFEDAMARFGRLDILHNNAGGSTARDKAVTKCDPKSSGMWLN